MEMSAHRVLPGIGVRPNENVRLRNQSGQGHRAIETAGRVVQAVLGHHGGGEWHVVKLQRVDRGPGEVVDAPGVIVEDRPGALSGGQRGIRRVTQVDEESLVVLRDIIADDDHRDGLVGGARRKF